MDSFLDQVYLNNTVLDYCIALAIILVGTVILRTLKKIFLKRLVSWSKNTNGSVDDVIFRSFERFGVAALQFAIIYWGISYLELSSKFQKVFHVATSVIVTYFILRLLSTIILIILQTRIRQQDGGEDKIKQLGGLMIIINIVIWVTGIVFLLDNLDYNVTTIITGLGIGGIAIALAAQNILGDLFNYFVIFFDRPFEAGDFITVDDKAGVVEYVGIKTTRIRSISGEQIIIGNSNLTGSRIHNHKRLYERRVVFNINVDYRTPVEQLEKLPRMIKGIIESQQPIRFDRCHIAAFGDWSIKIEVVYFVLDPDFNKYMDIQQRINLAILRMLNSLDVSLVAIGHISVGHTKA